MDYLRYYFSNLLMLAGIAGCVLGGGAGWLGFATFPAVVLLDLFELVLAADANRAARWPVWQQLPPTDAGAAS